MFTSLLKPRLPGIALSFAMLFVAYLPSLFHLSQVVWQEQRREQQDLQRLQQLVDYGTREDWNSNSPNRGKLLELLYEPNFQKVFQAMQSKKIKTLKDLNWAFPQRTSFFLARRGKLRISKEGSAKKHLPPDYAKRVLLALNMGRAGHLERELVKIYRFPPDEKTFRSLFGEFHFVSYNQQWFLYHFQEVNSYQSFVVLHLTGLDIQKLKSYALEHLISEHGAHVSFLKRILEKRVELNPWFLLPSLLILTICLIKPAWTNPGQSFSVRFFLFYLAFLIAIMAILQNVRNRAMVNFESSMKDEVMQSFLRDRQSIESGLDRFNSYYQKKGHEAFIQGRFLKEWSQEGLSCIRFTRGENFRVCEGAEESLDVEDHVRDLYLSVASVIFTNAGVEDFSREEPGFITRETPEQFALEEKFRNYFGYSKSRLFRNFANPNFRSDILPYLGKHKLGKVQFIRILHTGFYVVWYWSHDETSGHRFILSFMAGAKYYAYYLDRYKAYLPRKLENLKPAILSNYISDFYKPGESGFDSSDHLQFLLRKNKVRQNTFHTISVHGQEHFVAHLPSSRLDGFHFFFKKDSTELRNSLNQAKSQWDLFSIVLFLFLLLLPFWILFHLQSHVRKILSGFVSLKRGLVYLGDGSVAERGDEVTRLEGQFNAMVRELDEKERMAPLVATQIIHLLQDEDGSLQNSVEDRCAVLFSDIRSFTSISESLEPEEVVEMLNEYFALWQTAVQRHDGVVDLFVGDAIRVIFFSKTHKDFKERAIKTAKELMDELKDLNELRKQRNQFPIENGVGIACGEVNFSLIDGGERKLFCATGKSLEVSEKLEELSKYGSHSKIILESELAKEIDIELKTQLFPEGQEISEGSLELIEVSSQSRDS